MEYANKSHKEGICFVTRESLLAPSWQKTNVSWAHFTNGFDTKFKMLEGLSCSNPITHDQIALIFFAHATVKLLCNE